jgi:hypothetical protein
MKMINLEERILFLQVSHNHFPKILKTSYHTNIRIKLYYKENWNQSTNYLKVIQAQNTTLLEKLDLFQKSHMK